MKQPNPKTIWGAAESANPRFQAQKTMDTSKQNENATQPTATTVAVATHEPEMEEEILNYDPNVLDCDCVGRCNGRCVYSNTYSDTEDTDENVKNESNRICYCGDNTCDYSCGVLWCGCIDVCHNRCSLNN